MKLIICRININIIIIQTTVRFYCTKKEAVLMRVFVFEIVNYLLYFLKIENRNPLVLIILVIP